MRKNSLFRNKEAMVLLSAVMSLLVIGTVFYSAVEGWGWFDSLYFSTVTLATIGYGDLAPVTTIGKGFTIVYVITGIGLFLSLVTIVAEHARSNYAVQSEQYLKQA